MKAVNFPATRRRVSSGLSRSRDDRDGGSGARCGLPDTAGLCYETCGAPRIRKFLYPASDLVPVPLVHRGLVQRLDHELRPAGELRLVVCDLRVEVNHGGFQVGHGLLVPVEALNEKLQVCREPGVVAHEVAPGAART